MAKTILVRVAKRDIGYTKNPETGVMQKRWVGVPVKYSNLSFDQLCQNISESLGIPRSTIAAGVNAVAKQIRQLLLNGHTIRLGNLMYLRYSTVSKGVETDGTDAGNKQAAAEIFEEGGVREYLVTEHILTKPIGTLKRALDEINFRVVVVDD